jgi:hypothetical protein
MNDEKAPIQQELPPDSAPGDILMVRDLFRTLPLLAKKLFLSRLTPS